MIKGIGVDILSIERIDYKIARKVLSSEELEIFNSITNDKLKREYLAERFAVKEALFKADNAYFNYDQVTVLNDEKGKERMKYLEEYFILGVTWVIKKFLTKYI